MPRATRDTAMLHEASCTGLSPSADRLSRRFHSPRSCNLAVPQPRGGQNLPGLGCAPFARHYLGYHVLFSLPPGTKMFQFPGFASPQTRGYGSFTPVGCPIRTSADQRSPAPTRGFSQLATSFVAFLSHRHPPCALSCFLPCIMRRVFTQRTTRIPSAFSCDSVIVSFVVPVCQSPRQCRIYSDWLRLSLFSLQRWRISESNR